MAYSAFVTAGNSLTDDSSDLQSHLRSLVELPRESLAVEVKNWLNPSTPEGTAKIVRAVQALRNQDGGFLVIGFDDDTLKPLPEPGGFDIAAAYHQDQLQGLVSRYSSTLFEVFVHFVTAHGGNVFPIIRIPQGVSCPVACKRDLKDAAGKMLLTESHIYVRTLLANGTPSTAPANWRDIEPLIGRCFENRESDVARLLAKTLRGLTPEVSKSVARNLTALGERLNQSGVTVHEVLDHGAARFETVLKERKIILAKLGFLEIALRLVGNVPERHANKEFLQLLKSANPDLTGWPIWLVSDGFTDDSARPYPYEDRWEAFVYSPTTQERGSWGHLDYMIFDPKGDFYLRRALQDDMQRTNVEQTAGKTIEPIIQLLRVVEALAVGQAFAEAMGGNESTVLEYLFKWNGIKGRELAQWANPMWSFYFNGASLQNEASGRITMAFGANEEALIQATKEAIGYLTRSFGGYEFPENTIRHFVRKLLTRSL